MFLYYFYAPDTSRHVVLLNFNVKFYKFGNAEKCDFFMSQFSQLVLILSVTIFKIESMRLKFVIIAKMYKKDIENGLQNNFQNQH